MILTASGTGDMGSMTFGETSGAGPTLDTNNEARFFVPRVPYRLQRIIGHFSGAAGLADLSINVDSRHGPKHDAVLAIVEQRGVGADLNFRIRKDQEDDWIFHLGDVIVVTWTNPDTGNVFWGLEADLRELLINATR